MKKFVLLTFMLLSGLALSAQDVQTYVYKSYVIKSGTGIYEQQMKVDDKLSVSYYPNDKMYRINMGTDHFDCHHDDIGPINGKYTYFGKYYDSRREEIGNICILTKTPLSSFLYNNGLDANSNRFDESKAIQITMDGYDGFSLYPIKNKED